MNPLKDLLLDLAIGTVGIICLILAVFTSHWFFSPIVVTLVVMTIGRRIKISRTPAREMEKVVLYDSYNYPVSVDVIMPQKAKWSITWNKEDSG